MDAAIQIQNIFKSYENVNALSDISLDISKAELFGFIGPDGAGKTSLFRILSTLILPDSGSAKVQGLDVVKDYKALRTKLGYMPGRFSLYQDLTVEENLNFFAGIFNTTIKENYHLIEDIYTQIEPFRKRRAGDLSGGMKQKLALSCALIHKPEVLLLDEPTTGVDAVSRTEFWEMLDRLKKEGITIVVSTPYMDEAARCDRIALIQKGSLLSVDQPSRIIRSFKNKLYGIKALNMYDLVLLLRKYPECESAYLFGDWIHFSAKNDIDKNNLTTFLKENRMQEVVVKEISADIEDTFMELLSNKNLV